MVANILYTKQTEKDNIPMHLLGKIHLYVQKSSHIEYTTTAGQKSWITYITLPRFIFFLRFHYYFFSFVFWHFA